MGLDKHELSVEAKAQNAQAAELNRQLVEAEWWRDWTASIYGKDSDVYREAIQDVEDLKKRIREVADA